MTMSHVTSPDQPLTFLPEQKKQIDQCLLKLAKKVKSPLVMISDITGQLIVFHGKLSPKHGAGLSALAAGSFAAGLEIGNYLGLNGKNRFKQQLLEGKALNLNTVQIGEELLLITAFTRQTNLGLVRIFTERAQQELESIVKEASKNPRVYNLEEPYLDDAMETAIKRQLNDMFDN